MQLYPNPASDDLTLDINTLEKTTLELKVVNLIGEIIFVKQAQVVPGKQKIVFDVSSLAKSEYFIIISDMETKQITKTLKFLKK